MVDLVEQGHTTEVMEVLQMGMEQVEAEAPEVLQMEPMVEMVQLDREEALTEVMAELTGQIMEMAMPEISREEVAEEPGHGITEHRDLVAMAHMVRSPFPGLQPMLQLVQLQLKLVPL